MKELYEIVDVRNVLDFWKNLILQQVLMLLDVFMVSI